uniref:Neur_chan_LBD domain-containing protein n=1 Tax=Heterorhabditis bacteriophora TaxID=37862 RepID=A0A1I7WHZ3_HETBA
MPSHVCYELVRQRRLRASKSAQIVRNLTQRPSLGPPTCMNTYCVLLSINTNYDDVLSIRDIVICSETWRKPLAFIDSLDFVQLFHVTLENALSIAPFWRETTALVNSNFLNISVKY